MALYQRQAADVAAQASYLNLRALFLLPEEDHQARLPGVGPGAAEGDLPAQPLAFGGPVVSQRDAVVDRAGD